LTGRFLLDANILSDLLRNPQGRVAARIDGMGNDDFCTSIIVAAEIRYGAAKKDSARLTAQLEAILGGLDILPFETPADAIYGKLRSRLEKAGTPIGPNDLLIAAHALASGCILVTDNMREFSRIQELPLENWLV
jgi:tRNA(fMet)-specific endonuclease VapC